MPMSKKATIYRMVVVGEHICPYGLKAYHLLKKHGFLVEDIHLKSKEENERFKKERGVSDTPQIYIEGKQIGNDDDLKRYLGYNVKDNEKTYKPVIATFTIALILSFIINYLVFFREGFWMIIPNFIAISMILLALLKLQDLESFSTMFLGYDLLAQKWVPYAYIYPFGELTAGVLMLAGVLPIISIPVALFIGTIGAISIYKAVYIDKRELKCACVGGGSKVPLGFVSLSENLMMIAMAIYMLVKVIY